MTTPKRNIEQQLAALDGTMQLLRQVREALVELQEAPDAAAAHQRKCVANLKGHFFTERNCEAPRG